MKKFKRGIGCGLFAAGAALLAAASAGATIVPWTQTMLWQEQYYWDGLLQARNQAARQQADPNLLQVVRIVAQQTAQQTANLKQIQTYAQAQQNNLRFAFSQKDPTRSLETIRDNLETLARGTDQIKNNLYYLTTRVRMADSQALPDPELTKNAVLLIAQIQAVQVILNGLYADTVALESQVAGATWLKDKVLKYNAQNFLRSVIQVQSSVFSVYNAAYELHQRSR